jgi:hypothetical protein
MANKFTRFLTSVGKGALQPKGQMGDFRHATRLFVDNTYALAPRTKFSYYVYFDIDPQALQAPGWAEKHKQEAGLLVKSAQLPKFTIDTVVKNQYNRKKVIQKQIQYDPLSITFHDDNVGVINAMWAQYMGYYYRDRHNEMKQFYDKDPYHTTASFNERRYGLDNNSTVPFFRSIQIYTMARKRFQGYTLVNPIITSWQHGDVDNAGGGQTVEASMNVQYEAVLYSAGSVKVDRPKGFAKLHYDKAPSPLSILGGGTATLFGDQGILSGATEIFGDIAGGAAFDNPQNFLKTALMAVNTFNNISKLSKESLLAEGTNLILGGGTLENAASGSLSGSSFPQRAETNASTYATQKVSK